MQVSELNQAKSRTSRNDAPAEVDTAETRVLNARPAGGRQSAPEASGDQRASHLNRRLFVLETLLSRLAHAERNEEGKDEADETDQDAGLGADGVPVDYEPAELVRRVRQYLGLVSDRHLALLCDLPYKRFRNIKEKRLPMSPTLLLRFHELTGIDTATLRQWMGDHNELFRRNAIHQQMDRLGTRKCTRSSLPSAHRRKGAGSAKAGADEDSGTE